jgi:transposase-like protein
MHKTRTPLLKWFWAMFLAITDKRGISALALTLKIDVSYKTAWGMLHKIRKAMGVRDADYQLAGFIQVDDAFFKGGLKKGGDKRGRGTSMVPVLVMAAIKDEALTFAKMDVVEHVDSVTVKNTFEKYVASSQTIISDGFPSYNIAKKIGHEHRPDVVYPTKGKPNYDVLKWVNILVSNAKAFILGTFHGVQKKHLQKYLDEYCYRFNRRWWQSQGLDRLLMACAKSGPVGLSELMA